MLWATGQITTQKGCHLNCVALRHTHLHDFISSQITQAQIPIDVDRQCYWVMPIRTKLIKSQRESTEGNQIIHVDNSLWISKRQSPLDWLCCYGDSPAWILSAIYVCMFVYVFAVKLSLLSFQTLFWHFCFIGLCSAAVSDGEEGGRVENTEWERQRSLNQTPQGDETWAYAHLCVPDFVLISIIKHLKCTNI